jgi:hypothetical protein
MLTICISSQLIGENEINYVYNIYIEYKCISLKLNFEIGDSSFEKNSFNGRQGLISECVEGRRDFVIWSHILIFL